MEYITLKGAKIPKLGYGTWMLEGRDCVKSVEEAFFLGYRHIDTAQIYANEECVGEAIENSDVSRDQVFLTTKIWRDFFHSGDLQASLETSLKKLRTDYVDLLLLHWPVPEVPLEETIKALKQVQQQGKARLIGVSNFTVDMMADCLEMGVDIACNQVEYHPYLSQKPVLGFIHNNDMFLTAYSPIARGKVMKDPVLQEISAEYDKSPAQIVLRWLLQQERVAAIPKAAALKHMKANFDIFDFALSPEKMEQIHELARPDGRLIRPDWEPEWDTAEEGASPYGADLPREEHSGERTARQ